MRAYTLFAHLNRFKRVYLWLLWEIHCKWLEKSSNHISAFYDLNGTYELQHKNNNENAWKSQRKKKTLNKPVTITPSWFLHRLATYQFNQKKTSSTIVITFEKTWMNDCKWYVSCSILWFPNLCCWCCQFRDWKSVAPIEICQWLVSSFNLFFLPWNARHKSMNNW